MQHVMLTIEDARFAMNAADYKAEDYAERARYEAKNGDSELSEEAEFREEAENAENLAGRIRESLLAPSAYPVRIGEEFDDISDGYGAAPGAALLTTLYILGVPHHLTAIRVTGDGEQTAVDPALREELEKVYALYDYALVTTEIPGFDGEYVIYATPHGD